MNDNCLVGMRCPRCGSYGPFSITAQVWVDVEDDGAGATRDFEWDDNSACICCECHYGITVDGITVEDFKYNWVVLDMDLPDGDNKVFGPTKRPLCEVFVAGRRHCDLIDFHLRYLEWENYAPKEEVDDES